MTQQSIIRLPEVLKRTAVSRSFIYAAIKAGTFPAPVALGARAVGFISSSVDDWIASRVDTPKREMKLKPIPPCTRKRRTGL